MSVVPLFKAETEGIAGKVKLRIEYSSQLAAEDKIGRETTQDVFLPKNGFLNY